VDAAAEAGVEWLVNSSLPEDMPFRAFVEKAETMKYAREVAKRLGLKNVSIQYAKPILNPKDGVVEFRWSTIDENTYLPPIATQSDLGPIVKNVLQKPEEWKDAEIPIVGEALTLPQMAEIYGKVYNVPTRAVFLDSAPQEAVFEQWVDMHRNFK